MENLPESGTEAPAKIQQNEESNLENGEEATEDRKKYMKLKQRYKLLQAEYAKVLQSWEGTHKRVKELTQERKFLRAKLEQFMTVQVTQTEQQSTVTQEVKTAEAPQMIPQGSLQQAKVMQQKPTPQIYQQHYQYQNAQQQQQSSMIPQKRKKKDIHLMYQQITRENPIQQQQQQIQKQQYFYQGQQINDVKSMSSGYGGPSESGIGGGGIYQERSTIYSEQTQYKNQQMLKQQQQFQQQTQQLFNPNTTTQNPNNAKQGLNPYQGYY